MRIIEDGYGGDHDPEVDVMAIEARANYEFGVWLRNNPNIDDKLSDDGFVTMQKLFVYAYTKGITHYITGGQDD